MARAINASPDWKPKARRVISRSFVFKLSTRAFFRRWVSVFSIKGTYSRMVRLTDLWGCEKASGLGWACVQP